MTEQIIINHVSKSLGDVQVLTDIDFDMHAGRIYGFIGPSGAGKTTLVRMIAGMDYPTKGSIYVRDKTVPHMSLMHEIGFMAQSDALYLDLTGRENLEFYASLYSLNRQTKEKRIRYTADLVGLTHDLKKRVSHYSGGMKRRLSLATALLHDPTILILDEPTVGIDPELRSMIWDELDKLKQQGKTIIITTHVMDEAERCDDIVMIKDGMILTEGSPEELKARFHAASFDEVFINAGKKQVSQ